MPADDKTPNIHFVYLARDLDHFDERTLSGISDLKTNILAFNAFELAQVEDQVRDKLPSDDSAESRYERNIHRARVIDLFREHNYDFLRKVSTETKSASDDESDAYARIQKLLRDEIAPIREQKPMILDTVSMDAVACSESSYQSVITLIDYGFSRDRAGFELVFTEYLLEAFNKGSKATLTTQKFTFDARGWDRMSEHSQAQIEKGKPILAPKTTDISTSAY